MPGVNSLLNLGSGALFASQSAIQVTGDNISNVNTKGYSRRNVRLEESTSINWKPGQIGTVSGLLKFIVISTSLLRTATMIKQPCVNAGILCTTP